MRIYYVFDIKKEYISLYRDTPSNLYNVLFQLYRLRKKDIDYGYNMFKQIVKKIDKEKINQDIFLTMHNKMTYVKKGPDHIINNLYKDEVTILRAKNAYIVINTNKSYTEFFNVLMRENGNNYFVCDFQTNDYFFLSSIKMLV